MGNLAHLHSEMGRHDLALPLFRDALQRSRRVLGNRHPDTLVVVAKMGKSLCGGNDTVAGIALLEEAAAGRIALLGADHPDTRDCQEFLDSVKQEQEEDETIADRIRKKRRRRA